MNRSLYIVIVPVLLVALGYVLVLRSMGIAPGYARLVVAIALFFGAAWWLGRKTPGKAGAGPRGQ